MKRQNQCQFGVANQKQRLSSKGANGNSNLTHLTGRSQAQEKAEQQRRHGFKLVKIGELIC